MSSCFSRCLRVPIAIRAFYESYLWILQTLLLRHPDLHPGLIGQLERFVQDKVLVYRRERASIGEKLSYARARRDEVVGSTARDRIEAEIDRLATRDESLD